MDHDIREHEPARRNAATGRPGVDADRCTALPEREVAAGAPMPRSVRSPGATRRIVVFTPGDRLRPGV